MSLEIPRFPQVAIFDADPKQKNTKFFTANSLIKIYLPTCMTKAFISKIEVLTIV